MFLSALRIKSQLGKRFLLEHVANALEFRQLVKKFKKGQTLDTCHSKTQTSFYSCVTNIGHSIDFTLVRETGRTWSLIYCKYRLKVHPTGCEIWGKFLPLPASVPLPLSRNNSNTA